MYGLPPRRHLLKVYPFCVRLKAAEKGLKEGIVKKDREEIVRGIEDVGFWTARLIAEVISSAEGVSTPDDEKSLKMAFQSIYDANYTAIKGRLLLYQRFRSQ